MESWGFFLGEEDQHKAKQVPEPIIQQQPRVSHAGLKHSRSVTTSMENLYVSESRSSSTDHSSNHRPIIKI